jgi:O-ureido-D-serine cyclo-ligase
LSWDIRNNLPLLYARVDVAGAGEGMPVLMELELVDPSLSLALASQAAPSLAAAIAGRAGRHGRG